MMTAMEADMGKNIHFVASALVLSLNMWRLFGVLAWSMNNGSLDPSLCATSRCAASAREQHSFMRKEIL